MNKQYVICYESSCDQHVLVPYLLESLVPSTHHCWGLCHPLTPTPVDTPWAKSPPAVLCFQNLNLHLSFYDDLGSFQHSSSCLKIFCFCFSFTYSVPLQPYAFPSLGLKSMSQPLHHFLIAHTAVSVSSSPTPVSPRPCIHSYLQATTGCGWNRRTAGTGDTTLLDWELPALSAPCLWLAFIPVPNCGCLKTSPFSLQPCTLKIIFYCGKIWIIFIISTAHRIRFGDINHIHCVV